MYKKLVTPSLPTTGRHRHGIIFSGCRYGHPFSPVCPFVIRLLIPNSQMWYLCSWWRDFNKALAAWHKYSTCEWAVLRRFKVTGQGHMCTDMWMT